MLHNVLATLHLGHWGNDWLPQTCEQTIHILSLSLPIIISIVNQTLQKALVNPAKEYFEQSNIYIAVK